MLLFNPFEQFLVTNHIFIEKSWAGLFSNINHSIYINDTIIICIFMIVFIFSCYILLSFRKNKKSILFDLFRSIYKFMYNLVSSYLPSEGKKYFPFFFYLFMFIALSNLIGILPYSFTITSHLSITFALAFIVWFGCTIAGFVRHGFRFFSLFFPRGVPFVLVPFLVGIEIVSYLFRSVSLALRLFANIVAGHILLDTLALFIHSSIYPAVFTLSSTLIVILPFGMCIVLILFELIVAVLQAYIFIVLSCIYMSDVFNAQKH